MATIGKLVNKSLKSKLVELIRLRGPMTVADYMKIVLTNPESGFYMNDDVFGVKGHFTTNPEISQIFGEVLGAWIMQEWTRFKCPTPLRLVEFGPGRGTLMADIARTLKSLGVSNRPQVNLIELSPHLQQVQQKTLKDHSLDARWFSNIESMKEDEDDKNGFTAYIAHEFLDALPIYKFVRDPTTKKWRDLLIDYDDKENLRFCISNKPSLSSRLLIPDEFRGDHIEVCPQAALELEKVTKKINENNSGCALVCDYGFETEPEPNQGPHLVPKSDRDTFRAFKNHQPWPPLRDPGDADLTADVDFAYLKRHLKDKATIFGPVNQRDFLLKCGLQARVNKLMSQAKNDEEKQELSSEASMLVDSMGDRYKFMALFPKDSSTLFKDDPPAGFG